jgi:hypothetical protein
MYNLLNITICTLNNLFVKYNYYYVNNIQLTSCDYDNIKNEHKLTKKLNILIQLLNI